MKMSAICISSMLQMCTICLDTDSKLYILGKCKLGQAFGHLIGYTLHKNQWNKIFLCSECIHRLLGFMRFRRKSLTGISVMKDLLRKHKKVTVQHVKSVDRQKYKLKSAIVQQVLEPNHCDLYIDHSHEGQTNVDAEYTNTMAVSIGDLEDVMKEDRLSTKSATVNECDDKRDGYLSDSTLVLETKPNFADEEEYEQFLLNEMEKNENYMAVSQNLDTKTEKNLESSKKEPNNRNNSTNTEKSSETAKKFQGKLKFETDTEKVISDYFRNSEINEQVNNSNIAVKDESREQIENRQVMIKFETTENITESDDVRNNKVNLLVEQENKSESVKVNQPYSCQLCDYKCKLKISLTVHERTHNSDSFTCDICNYKCKLRHILNVHMKEHSKGEPDVTKNYVCDICKTKFTVKSQLEAHLTEHAGKRSFKCNLCHFECKLRHKLNLHMKTHKVKSTCNSKLTLNYNLSRDEKLQNPVKRHVYKISDNKIFCSDNIATHAKSHTKEYVCQHCHEQFTCQNDLDNHIIHTKVKSEFDCESRDVLKHMRTYTAKHRVRVYTCEICDAKFKTSPHRDRHMVTHSGDKPFACQICEQKFTQKVSLNRHMMLHTKKQFLCDTCSFKSASKIDLIIHKRTHTGEKPYACVHCEFRCSRKYNLLTHMRTHSGVKPFVCTICHCNFTRTSELLRHMRTHTGETFSCNICKYKCTRRTNLRTHMRVHNGGMLSCDYCGYQTAQKACLKVHILKHMSVLEGHS